VVGRTRFCIHPAEWVATVPHVGGTKDADVAKILALQPDLVVADKDENPLATVQALQEAGVEVLWSEIDGVQDAADFLRTLGTRCGVAAAGGRLAGEVEAALGEVTKRTAGAGTGPVPVFCPIWYDPWMTFDRTAYPHAMLEAVGLRNVFGDHAGPKYFQVTAQEVAASQAAWTLLPTEPYPFHKRRDAVATSALGAAGQEGQVVEIDGEALTWFGVRTASGLRELAKIRASLGGPPIR